MWVTLLILSHFSKISPENKIILVSLRPNYFIFIGYFKTGMGVGEGDGMGLKRTP